MKHTALVAFFFFALAMGQAIAEIPNNPRDVALTSTSHSITVTWTANADGITDGYYVHYWKTSSSLEPTRVTVLHSDTALGYTHIITGLSDSTDYTVKVTAYDGLDESNAATHTIRTTVIEVDIKLIDADAIEISLAEGAASIETYNIYVGTAHVVPDPVTQIPDVSQYDVLSATGLVGDTVYTLDGLSKQTYYVLVQVNYGGGNAGYSPEMAFTVDDFGTFFSSAGDIDNGCFIASTSGASFKAGLATALSFLAMGSLFFLIRLRMLLPALILIGVCGSSGFAQETRPDYYRNIVGIKGGAFFPSEDLQRDVYDSVVPISLFYERMVTRIFSADASAGYCRAKGYALTASSEETGVKTDLDMIPTSMSLNVNLDVTELITLYLGAGGDYWFFKEKSRNGDYDNHVGGWHGKAGVKLFTADSQYFKKGGVLIEASYTSLDRFGENAVDLGGWTYSLGVMYCF